MKRNPNFKLQTSNIVLTLISGILLSLVFPKFNLWPLAWVALVPFFMALKNAKTWQSSALAGFLFGTVFFGIHLFWVISLFRFGGWWIVTGWVGLIIFQALFLAVFALSYYYLISNFKSLPAGRQGLISNFQFLIFPLLWTFIEWLRLQGPFGISAGAVGYSQAAFLPLIQIASFSSVYGVSFLVVLMNAAVAEVIADQKKWRILLGVLLLFLIAISYGVSVISHSSLVISHFPKLALIQPNIDQKDKMDYAQVFPVYEIQAKLTRQAAAENPDVIIWPETAVFAYLLRDPILWPRFQALINETKTCLVVGTPYHDSLRNKIYNSIVSFSNSGEILARFDKEHLVPFGEYLPFKPLLFPLLKGTGYFDQNYDPARFSEPFFVRDLKVAPAICFESTFPALIASRVGPDTAFILTLTNDAWFGASAAPYFHLNNGVFRAIENRKYFVQVGNTGISAVIDPYGRILKRSQLNKREIVIF
ncbi:MAG: apolipoprotein N-acyltransferase [Candidatus Margulisbacteria bacterium]|nr:apolipoprotein N-acyltransferase [Candidatus Margulisiibacteriota bacterium]